MKECIEIERMRRDKGVDIREGIGIERKHGGSEIVSKGESIEQR